MANDKAILEGTIFEGTEILWVDGRAHMVKIDNVKMSECRGLHYVDVVSNQKYHVKSASYDNPWCELVGYRSISNKPTMSSLLDYMDKGILNKVVSGNFTDADSIDFVKKVEKTGPIAK